MTEEHYEKFTSRDGKCCLSLIIEIVHVETNKVAVRGHWPIDFITNFLKERNIIAHDVATFCSFVYQRPSKYGPVWTALPSRGAFPATLIEIK